MNLLPFAMLGLGGPELLVIATIVAMLLIPLVALWILPAIFSYVILSRIPPEHRKQDPGLALLLLIPLFSLIWAFFVYPRIADSLKSYFASRSATNVGNCGRDLALATCICGACVIVPFAGFAALILMIIFFAKAFDLSRRIGRTT
jgi:hypothetical protein